MKSQGTRPKVLPLISDLDFIVCGVGNLRWGIVCFFLIYRLFDQGYIQMAMFRKRTDVDRDLWKTVMVI